MIPKPSAKAKTSQYRYETGANSQSLFIRNMRPDLYWKHYELRLVGREQPAGRWLVRELKSPVQEQTVAVYTRSSPQMQPSEWHLDNDDVAAMLKLKDVASYIKRRESSLELEEDSTLADEESASVSEATTSRRGRRTKRAKTS